MKKALSFGVSLIFLWALAACATLAPPASAPAGTETSSQNNADSGGLPADSLPESQQDNASQNDDGTENMLPITLQIGNSAFSASLYDNDAARELLSMFPLTLDMQDLNGNEKYYYLDESLPTDSRPAGSIAAGDIMLYGSDCLVLFYESFSSSYSYTPLGRIDDAAGFAAAVGGGDVQVAFMVQGGLKKENSNSDACCYCF